MRARDGAVSGGVRAREQGDAVKSVVRQPETLLEPAQLQNAKMVSFTWILLAGNVCGG